MHKYAMFLKELLSNKRKLEEVFMAMLDKEHWIILQNKLPRKFKDQQGFILPCLIRSFIHEKALVNLEASINVVLYGIFKKLD